MMISTKGRYALKIMVDLTQNRSIHPVNIKVFQPVRVFR